MQPIGSPGRGGLNICMSVCMHCRWACDHSKSGPFDLSKRSQVTETPLQEYTTTHHTSTTCKGHQTQLAPWVYIQMVHSRWMGSQVWVTATFHRHLSHFEPLEQQTGQTADTVKHLLCNTRVLCLTTCANYTILHAIQNNACFVVYLHKCTHLIRLAFMAFHMLLQVVLHAECLCTTAVGAPATTHT